jgi:hypothetical protein
MSHNNCHCIEMCRRDPDELGQFSQELVFRRLHRGPGKGHQVPLCMVVNIGCTSRMGSTSVLLVHAHIMQSHLSSQVYQLMAHNIEEETNRYKHDILYIDCITRIVTHTPHIILETIETYQEIVWFRDDMHHMYL